MSEAPQPPFLIIRRGVAFWVERHGHDAIPATPQALREGCFHDAVCVDRSGFIWPIAGYELDRRPSVLSRLMALTAPVRLLLGPRQRTDANDVALLLAEVLQQENDFTDYLNDIDLDPEELSRRFGDAGSVREIVSIAEAEDAARPW